MIFINNKIVNQVNEAYNNSVVEFTAPGAAYCRIETVYRARKDTFLVYPNHEGLYYFNFKEVATSYINENYFADSYDSAQVNSLTKEENAFIEIVVTYYTSPIGGVEPPPVYCKYKFIRAVRDISDKLTPTKKLLHGNRVTLFDNCPFTLSLLGNNPIVKINGIEKTLTAEEGVHRLTLSGGQSLSDWVYKTINEIEYAGETLILERKQGCGHYLKWLNNYGGWDYFMFQELKRDRKVKFKGTIDNNSKNIANTTSAYKSRGYKSGTSITLSAYSDNVNYIHNIARSPKVYLYIAPIGSQNNRQNWIEVLVKAKGKRTPLQRSSNLEIQIPEMNMTI